LHHVTTFFLHLCIWIESYDSFHPKDTPLYYTKNILRLPLNADCLLSVVKTMF